MKLFFAAMAFALVSYFGGGLSSELQATVGSCKCDCVNPDTGNSWPAYRDIPDDVTAPGQHCASQGGGQCGGENCPDCYLNSCVPVYPVDGLTIELRNPAFIQDGSLRSY